MFPLILTPFDVARTKAMCEIGPKNTQEYTKVFRTITRLMTRDGAAGPWRGAVYGMGNSLLQSVLLITGSHWLSRDVRLDVTKFFVLNAMVASLLYPIDTIT